MTTLGPTRAATGGSDPVPPGPDPRIRARREEVAAEGTRRRRRRWGAVAVAVAVLALGAALLLGPLLDVDEIVVEGATHVSDAEVRRVADVRVGTPLVRVDADAVARRVEELPWVSRAEVQRSWPGTLVVRVREREAVAWVRHPGGDLVVLDAGGRVLGPLEAPPAGAVEVVGARRLPEAGGTLHPARAAGVRDGLGEPLASRVVAVDVSGGANAVVVGLADGVVVRLGDLEALPAKAAAALAVLEFALERDEPVDYVDVSVPGAPVAGGGGSAPAAVDLPGLDAPLQDPARTASRTAVPARGR